ncbi:MAG: DUF4173 domain-containing protein [Bacteroidota bacterium]
MQSFDRTTFRLPLTLALALTFNVVFWNESLGLNLFLFSGLLMGTLLYLQPQAWKSQAVVWTTLGTVLSAAMVVAFNSTTAKVIHLCSLLAWAGFVHAPQFRSLLYAVGQSGQQFLGLGNSLGKELGRMSQANHQLRRVLPYLKVSLVPILVLGIFFAIFYGANPAFAEATESIVAWLNGWWKDFSWGRIGFFLLGFFLVGGLIFHRYHEGLQKKAGSKQDEMVRKRKAWGFNFPFLALKGEYRMAVVLLASVNLLLLVNNVLDVQYIWGDFGNFSGPELKQFVHEGTYLLILSVLLAMGIMLHFFRGNLNFYRKNRPLRFLSYAWILQNALLVLGVGVRNYHYIAANGLAYKRIGVVFFLLLTLFGLFTLFLKIRDRLSTYYLFRANGWALYGMMMLMCLVNWDPFIAQYNLDHFEKTEMIDRDFLLSLSDKTLALYLTHEEALLLKDQSSTGYANYFQSRLNGFADSWEEKSWLSWNWADHQSYTAVKARLSAQTQTSQHLNP